MGLFVVILDCFWGEGRGQGEDKRFSLVSEEIAGNESANQRGKERWTDVTKGYHHTTTTA